MIANHFDTGILLFEGTYDPGTKTISYFNETEETPGVKVRSWKLVRFVDSDHYTEEGYEEEGTRKVKVTELNFTRTGN
jgi:hypothetical protein